MRSAIQIAVAVVLACLCIDACAVLDGGLGLSADQLIDESRGDYVIYTGIPENPQASRELWSTELGLEFNKSTGTFETSSDANLTGATASDAAFAAASATAIAAATSTSSAATSATVASSASATASARSSATSSDPDRSSGPASSNDPASSTDPASLSNSAPSGSSTLAAALQGNWSFRLKDEQNRILALRLFSSGETIFGAGSINDGVETSRVSASGVLASRNLSLDVTLDGGKALFRLDLAVDAEYAYGQYRAFSQDREPWSGMAQGEKL